MLSLLSGFRRVLPRIKDEIMCASFAAELMDERQRLRTMIGAVVDDLHQRFPYGCAVQKSIRTADVLG